MAIKKLSLNGGIALAGIIVLLILLFWKISYPLTCFAWFFPALIFILIISGQFEYFMLYRKCRADCFFNHNSWIYTWMTGKIVVTLSSIMIAIPVTLSLVSFTALATITDGVFILISAIITTLIFPFVSM